MGFWLFPWILALYFIADRVQGKRQHDVAAMTRQVFPDYAKLFRRWVGYKFVKPCVFDAHACYTARSMMDEGSHQPLGENALYGFLWLAQS
jgi:hypothetical protein